MKSVAYLGGFFLAEASLRQSFIDNNVQLVFPVEGKYNWVKNHPVYKGYVDKYVTDVEVEVLRDFLTNLKPDVVIHRYYRGDPWLYPNARAVCKTLGIPYVAYRIETHPLGPIAKVDCDVYMYAHKCDEPYLPKMDRSYHFPYCVSSFEKRLDLEKKYEIASFGWGRIKDEGKLNDKRMSSFLLYYNAVKSLSKTLDVFWDDGDVGEYKEKFGNYISNIKFNKQFNIEEQIEYLNSTKIVVNVDTAYMNVKGYSHKMFQSMGCGIPTITYYKHGIEKDFGPNWETAIYVSTSNEAAAAIERLLKDDLLREDISENAYTYMHNKYNWFNNFNEIMTKEGIWNG